MALNLNSTKFQSYKNKAATKAQKSSGFNDPRFITFEANKKYKFRLLWWEDEKPETDKTYRDSPFAETYIHSAKDESGKRHTITCPTTFDPTRAGFQACKCCETSSALYKSGKAGSQKDADLYALYKRKFHGYALVYVVSDPTNPDNNGTVKMMHYSIKAKQFLDSEIFGIESTWGDKDDDDEDSGGDEVGEAAFQLKQGFDLIVTVKKNGQWNDYQFKFARNASDVKVNEDTLEDEIKALKFDEIRKVTAPVEIEKFYTDVILGNDSQATVLDSVDEDEDTTDHGTTDSEISSLFDDSAEDDSDKSEASSDDEDDFDVDAFLQNVDE